MSAHDLTQGPQAAAAAPTAGAAAAAAQQFFAIAPRGLEALLADELAAVGAQAPRPTGGGVSFGGTLPIAYAANLHSRLASRILWRRARGEAGSFDALYDLARAVRWEDHFDAHQTLRIDLTAQRAPHASLEFALLRIKDGIVDALRERTGARPSIDRAHPDVRVFAHLEGTQATLYLDLSGAALFKRGWRAEKGEAPLKENLAAGLLMLAGWTPQVPLFDPFCGSGTLVIEAATMAARRAPGLSRRFAFERLHDFDASAWRDLRQAARAGVDDTAAACLVGADISTQVVALARQNAARAGLDAWLADGRLAFIAADARSAPPPFAGGLIISNPPYGEQSSPRSATTPKLMRQFGDALKQRYAGWSAWLLSADLDLPGQMRLAETRRTVLYNGPLECRLFRFDIVAGRFRPRAERAEATGET